MFFHLLFSVITHHYSKSASTVIWCHKRPDLYFKGMCSVLVQMVLIMFSVITHHTDVSRSLSTSESSCSYSTLRCRGRDPISPRKMKKATHKMFENFHTVCIFTLYSGLGRVTKDLCKLQDEY